MDYKVILTCKSIWYYSQGDETAFFEWIKRISCIDKFDGIQDELYLYIKNKMIEDSALRELLALFCRYNIEMKQLSVFLNSKNKEWFFESKEAFWHKRVFGE